MGPYGTGCIKGYLFVAGGSAWVHIFIVTVASGQVSSVSCEHCPRRVLTDEWVSGACQIGSAVCVWSAVGGFQTCTAAAAVSVLGSAGSGSMISVL